MTKRRIILVIVLVAIIGSIAYLESKKVHSIRMKGAAALTQTPSNRDVSAKAAKYPRAPELISPDGYINTNDLPITLSQYIGKKVILVDFWTYSCINCQRTIPYLNDWYRKYKDDGLVIIGVQSPEFEFEKNIDNVKAAVAKLGIGYPVVLDNEHQTWDAYNNYYWPEEYLIDIDGFIVDRHIGEGDFVDTEQKIQGALTERKHVLGESGTINTSLDRNTYAITTQSPETYFGSARNEYLANGIAGKSGSQNFTLPSHFNDNKLYLSGNWNVTSEYAESAGAEDHIVYNYNAKDVYFVASADKPVSITVLRDGKPVDISHGADVAPDGSATIQRSRLYHLVDEPIATPHTLEIIVHGTGLRAYTFTFG